MKRFELALLCGIVAAVILSSLTAFAGECEDVRGQVLRLHVLANSDSEDDQQLKLAVRDAILIETAGMFTTAPDKDQVEAAAKEHLAEIEAVAAAEVARRGYDYTVKAELVNMFFDTRTYDGAMLPAGRYDALRLTIGAGAGKNWWCMMFPPMCIPAVTDSASDEVSEQISHLGERPNYEPAFAVVELVETVREKLSA